MKTVISNWPKLLTSKKSVLTANWTPKVNDFSAYPLSKTKENDIVKVKKNRQEMNKVKTEEANPCHVVYNIQQPLLIAAVIPSLFRPWLWYKSLRGNRREYWEAIWGKQSIDGFAYRASCTVYAVLASSQPPELTARIVEVLGLHIFIQGNHWLRNQLVPVCVSIARLPRPSRTLPVH